MSRFSFLTIILIVLITATTNTQVPKFVSYQGIIQNAADEHHYYYDSLYAIVIEIYDSETGGNLLWQEEQEVQTQEGVFHVLLGTENELDLEIFNQNEELWIQTTIGEEVLSSRIKLTSAPYAIKSEYAEVLGENDIFLVDTAHTRDPESLTDTLRNNYWYIPSYKSLFIKPEVRIKEHLQIGDSSLHLSSQPSTGTSNKDVINSSGYLYIQDNSNYSSQPTDMFTIIAHKNQSGQGSRGVGIGMEYDDVPDFMLDVNGTIRTGGTADPELVFSKPISGGGTTNVRFKANNNQSASTYYLPANVGSPDYVLVTDGTQFGAELSWKDPATLITGGGDTDWDETISNDFIVAKPGGIAINGATLIGNNANTHINFGFGSTSGSASGNEIYIAIGGGNGNEVTGDFSTISGGQDNILTNNYSFLGGGLENTSTGESSVLSGGENNRIEANYGTIAGGQDNNITGEHSSVGGGWNNDVSSNFSNIAGGQDNITNGNYSNIGGGYTNDVEGSFSVISGGRENTIDSWVSYGGIASGWNNNVSGDYANVSGGRENVTGANASFIGGGWRNSAEASYSMILGGTNNIVEGQYSAAIGGSNHVSTASAYGSIAAGYKGYIEGHYSGVSSGYSNTVSGDYSGISSGYENQNEGIYSGISAGYNNTITEGNYNFIGGGSNNMIYYDEPSHSVICGGNQNRSRYKGFVGGGLFNWAFGYASSVVGGKENNVNAGYSIIGGGEGNYTSGSIGHCGIFTGFNNTVSGNKSIIAGGESNHIYGDAEHNFIGGGYQNTINIPPTNSLTVPSYSVISGGYLNYNYGHSSMIGGGYNNVIYGGSYQYIGGGRHNVIPNYPDWDITLTYYSCIAGGYNNKAQYGSFVGGGKQNHAAGKINGIVSGYSNICSGYYTIIGGGENNSIPWNADNYWSGVFSGFSNTVDGKASVISGGYENNIVGSYSAISGGESNVIKSDVIASVISGGSSNAIMQNGKYNYIGGGKDNEIGYDSGFGPTEYATIAGGKENFAFHGSFIGGGFSNIVTGLRTSIAGGENNFVSGRWGAIAGGYGNRIILTELGAYSGALSGFSNTVEGYASVISGGYENNIVGSYSNIGGGYQNTIEGGYFNTISGGRGNYINPTSSHSGISSGWDNTVTGDYANISGGRDNYAGADETFIGGGWQNSVYSSGAIIPGGSHNTINNNAMYGVALGSSHQVDNLAGVAIGYDNYVAGNYSGILSGRSNTVTGEFSVITGGGYLAIGDRSAAYRGGFGANPGHSNTIDLTNSAAPWDQETFYIVDTKFWFNTENHPDADFRVDGAGVNLLYADASEDRVGIRNDDPQYEMDVNGAIRTGRSGQDGHLIIYSDQNDQATPAEYEIHFQPADNMVQNTYYTLPENHGHLNDVLVTDGSGVLSWADVCDLCDGAWDINGNVMYPGPSDILIGIGTIAPTHKMHINATDPLRLEGLTLSPDSLDEEVLVVNANGVVYKRDFPERADNDWTLSGNDMYNNNTGNVGIGTTTPSSLLDVNGDANVAQDMMVGDDLQVMDNAEINGSLFVATTTGIGRTVTDYELEVEGDASKTTAGDWQANSDRRIKTDIKEIDNPYKTVLSLHPVMFRYTPEYLKKHPKIADRFYYNFIAQEYAEVFPESVQIGSEKVPGTNEGIWNMDSYNAQVVSIKAVQELIKENQRQEQKITSLRKEVEELKELVKKMIR